MIRCRLVAREFKTKGDKNREELFEATLPLESKRMLMSRTASRRKDGRFKKMMFVDAKKAHLNPSGEDVFIELPEEAGAGYGKCGRLNYWFLDSDHRRKRGSSSTPRSSKELDLNAGWDRR